MKFKVIDFDEIYSICKNPLKMESLSEYLNGGRQDVLINPDIFCENVRSIDKNVSEKDFTLFERVDYINESVVIIFSIYLELFQYENKSDNILFCIDYYSKKYPKNKIVFYWNHDVDFKIYNNFVKNYKNVYIINYNTSEATKNDMVIPFWSFDTNLINESKTKFCSFVGSFNNNLRINLYNTFSQNNLYYFTNKLNSVEYKKAISQSIYNFAPRGIGLSSYRFFECIHSNTIPVLFADDVIMPFTDEVNYNDICIKIPEAKSIDFNYINKILHNTDYNKILNNISIMRNKFTLLGIQKYIKNKLEDGLG